MTFYGDPEASDYGEDEPCIGCIRGEHVRCEACYECAAELLQVVDEEANVKVLNCCKACKEETQ